MSQLDQGIANTNGSLIALLNDYRDQSDKASVGISSYWFHLESMTALVGSRPAALPQEILTPSAWGSIGLLANKMTQLAAEVIPRKELNKLLESSKTSYFDFVNEKIGMAARTQDDHCSMLKKALLRATKALGIRIGSLKASGAPRRATNFSLPSWIDPVLEAPLKSLENKMTTVPWNYQGDLLVGGELLTDVATWVEKRMTDVENKRAKIQAKGDENAIKFGGLHFTKISQATLWLEKELLNHPSGLIVDVRMVLKRAYHNMSNSDTLSDLQKCYKVKVLTIADGKIPKFF
jgi:hypothetical protein